MYQALYRRWRPQRFGEVVGQEHLTVTLRNALKQGRLAHAYAFCGPRGTGKTSAARILAKAVNCLEPVAGEPCNECDNCRAVNEGRSLDILEIDAASNRGIDEMRQLRERVGLVPVQGRYRVYIVDEAHMLTTEAFNALLKTLEEPPAHALFILATTEPRRMPATILSRCQRFDFHRLGDQEIRGRLRQVIQGEGFGEVEEEALGLIAAAAQGGLRDALGILEQCQSHAGTDDAGLTVRDVRQVLGLVADEVIEDILAAVAEGDAGRALRLADNLYQQGADTGQITRQMVEWLQGLMVYQEGGVSLLGGLNQGGVAQMAHRLPSTVVRELLANFIWVEEHLRGITNQRAVLELGLVKACHGAEDRGLAERLEKLEQRLARMEGQPQSGPGSGQSLRGAAEASGRPPTVDVVNSDQTPAGEAKGVVMGQPQVLEEVPAKPKAGSKAAAPPVPEEPQIQEDFIALWQETMNKLKKRRRTAYGVLQQARPVGIEGGRLLVALPREYQSLESKLREPENRQAISECLNQVFKQPLQLDCRLEEAVDPLADVLDDPVVRRALELFGGDLVKVVDE